MRVSSLPGRGAGIVLLAALMGCNSGGGGGGPMAPTTTTPARSRTVIGTFSFNLVSIPTARAQGLAFDFAGIDVTVSPLGDLDAIADWTFASNPVHLYLTSNTCTQAQFAVVGCTIQRDTEALTTKPRTLTAPGLNGNYRVWVVNLGNSAESGTVQVGVTR